MAFSLPTEFKSKSFWIDWTFYIAWILLVISVVCYAIFYAKAYIQRQKIDEIDEKIAIYGSAEQKANEKKVFLYKKKIDDFGKIVEGHTAFSPIFAFMEKVTLSNVWFSDLALSEPENQLVVSGETESMEMLSRQVDVLEKSKDYVDSVKVLDAQVNSSGRVLFNLSLFLNPKLFIYQ